MPDRMLEKPSKRVVLRRIFSTGMKGSLLCGMILGSIGTIVTSATGLSFLGIPSFIGIMGGTAIGMTKLGIALAALLACAGISVGVGIGVGLLVGVAIGVTGFLVKRHHDRKLAAKQAVVVELAYEPTQGVGKISRRLNEANPAAGLSAVASLDVEAPQDVLPTDDIQETAINDAERRSVYGVCIK